MKRLFFLTVIIMTFSNSYGQGFSFECGGYSFEVYEDETPLKFNFKSGDDIDYDYRGRVESIGDIDIDYDYRGRVESIGNVEIDYDYKGRIKSIGGMEIKYDYKGRFTGSSGNIGCRF